MNKKVQTDCLRACSKFIFPVIPSAVEGSHYVPEKYQGDVSTTLRLLNMTERAIFKQALRVCLIISFSAILNGVETSPEYSRHIVRPFTSSRMTATMKNQTF